VVFIAKLAAGDVLKAKLIGFGPRCQSQPDPIGVEHFSATIARWKARFECGRIAGMEARHKGTPPQRGDTSQVLPGC
jgi:hypothetical protein